MLQEFDLPFEDTTIHCWEGGQGFPVLMLHGSGAGASIPGNFKRVLEPLSRKYHVLAADLVGFGKSGRKKQPPYFDLDMWQRQALFLMQRLQGDIGVVGHSLSGVLALKLAATQPRVKRVLTTGTMGASFPCKPGTRLWRYPETRELLKTQTQVTVWNKALVDESEVDYRWNILTQPGYREYYESMFDGDKQYFIDKSALTVEELGQVKATVLMMHGRQDVSFPPEHTCLVLAPQLPADVWVLDKCGHSVALEYPEKFLAGADLLFGKGA